MFFKKQAGFTLVEVILAIGITALIAGPLTTGIFQINNVIVRIDHRIRALNDLQQAGRWLYTDGEVAESTNLIDNDPPTNTMSFSWNDGEAHTSTYYLSGTELQRDHNGNVITIARSISDAMFSISNQLITIELTSSPDSGNVEKDALYHILLR